jgi:CubicO group peptidase (beta-lactamase class C family)
LNPKRRRPSSRRFSGARPTWRAHLAALPRPVQALIISAVSVVVLLMTCSAPQPRSFAPITARPTSIAAVPVVQAGEPTVETQAPGSLSFKPLPTLTPTPIVLSASVADQEPTPEPPLAGAALQIDQYMNGLVESGAFQGATLVARDGRVLIGRGYGPANPDGTPNTARTRFRLASITKQFTAAAILILQAQGKLNVSDPICNYFDPCPEAWRSINLRHLLTHTSGIPDYASFSSFEPTEMNQTTPDELLSRFRDLPLGFAPGQLYSYGNSGYVLLGIVIEKVSGQSYADFLHDAIFAPLGMNDSGYDTNVGAITAPQQAQAYFYAGKPATFLDCSTLFSAGGLYSTVEDLYRWDQALYGDQLLPAALRDEMFTPLLREYAYGWKIENGPPRRISHAGLMTGVSTFIARYPDQHLTVIVLANMQSANAEGISNQLAELALSQ